MAFFWVYLTCWEGERGVKETAGTDTAPNSLGHREGCSSSAGNDLGLLLSCQLPEHPQVTEVQIDVQPLAEDRYEPVAYNFSPRPGQVGGPGLAFAVGRVVHHVAEGKRMLNQRASTAEEERERREGADLRGRRDRLLYPAAARAAGMRGCGQRPGRPLPRWPGKCGEAAARA